MRLMLVTERWQGDDRGWIENVLAAMEGGVDTVQLRDRDVDDTTFRRRLDGLLPRAPSSARFIVNRRVAIALEYDLGLHLSEDQPFAPAPEGKLLGRSVHGVDAAKRAAGEGVDYLIFGTVYPTPSKPGHAGTGPHALREVVDAVAPLRVLAIGGVTAARLDAILTAGAAGAAVCGAIFAAADPRVAARAFQRSARERRRRDG